MADNRKPNKSQYRLPLKEDRYHWEGKYIGPSLNGLWWSVYLSENIVEPTFTGTERECQNWIEETAHVG